MSEIDIIKKLHAISVIKENKTNVDYFIFDEFEIHQNKIPPNSKQEWHTHKIIEEVIVVTEGEICIRWKEVVNYFDNTYDYDFWRSLSMPDVYKLRFKGNVFLSSERIWKELI